MTRRRSASESAPFPITYPTVAERLDHWGNHPSGPVVLVLFALAEATIFPAPTEALFVALALSRRRRVSSLAAMATLASVAGAALGYAIGYAFYERLGLPAITLFGGVDSLEVVARAYRANLFVTLATSGYTPIPFVIYTLGAGALRVPFVPFLAYAAVGRTLKFAVLAILIHLLGPQVRKLLGRRLSAISVAVLLCILVTWWIVRRW